jgi:hypothetical protein
VLLTGIFFSSPSSSFLLGRVIPSISLSHAELLLLLLLLSYAQMGRGVYFPFLSVFLLEGRKVGAKDTGTGGELYVYYGYISWEK